MMNAKKGFQEIVIRLEYDRSFDAGQLFSFMKPRALAGLEIVEKNSYGRTFRFPESSGFFRVTDHPADSALDLQVCFTGKDPVQEIRERVRKMFDLDRDFTRINRQFSSDSRLAKGMTNGHVPRLPVAFDPFEFMIRAVLGQQISVKAATTLASRLAQRAGKTTGKGFPPGLACFFPFPLELSQIELEGLGITRTRQATIRAVCEGLLSGHFSLERDQDFDRFYKQFSARKGIGEWTVNYVAMRGLGLVDAFPDSDLGIIKSLSKDGVRPSKKQIRAMAENWRPYRAYAALCLWNS